MNRTGIDKTCSTCKKAIFDIYKLDDGLKIKGEPIGCRRSDSGMYQTIAQNNDGCIKYEPED